MSHETSPLAGPMHMDATSLAGPSNHIPLLDPTLGAGHRAVRDAEGVGASLALSNLASEWRSLAEKQSILVQENQELREMLEKEKRHFLDQYKAQEDRMQQLAQENASCRAAIEVISEERDRERLCNEKRAAESGHPQLWAI